MVLLCIPITHAMIGTSGTNYRPIITDKNISTLTTATISFFMYPEQITGRNFYIMQFGKNGIGDSTFTQSIYMASSKLYLLDDYSSTNDEGLWSVPIYNTTPQAICLRYNMNGNINNDPTFMINGTSMTVTEEITPTGILSHSTGKIWFLSGYKTSESGRFVGMMGEVAIWNVTLNDSQCKTLTTTWKSGIPLTIAPGNLVSY